MRRRLHERGPVRPRPGHSPDDFIRVSVPRHDCDLLRDLLIAERVRAVVEIGLAYGASALAIGEALAGGRHWVIDPYQDRAYTDSGWNLLVEAGLAATTTLLRAESSVALPALLRDGVTADAAFVDGSHRFHEVFVDLYYLRRIVRPGGLIVVDDDVPPVHAALRYFTTNLGWADVPVDRPWRCRALRLPPTLTEPAYTDFMPF
ncbi:MULTISPECIES: class I SAM-dependent methyltransferase [Catenuloplanes]|uniref:class I SAM-dependent methyltransferase n=1 Tax=Catenuloplanes TaxID=33874 RepID=UPI00286B35FA|nr:class I SAM-dependent methyltransferase [Catenuloplanes niger]